MTQITLTDPTARPLRRDAERNRRRILDAAGELFAQRGLAVTLNDIAHHAGVGVGTVYRRFPDKDRLIEELFEERFEELAELMREAVADDDPWRGLTGFLKRSGEMQSGDRGLRELMTGTPGELDRIARIRSRLLPMAEELVRRAHAGGQLRADISSQDLPVIQLMMGAVIDASRDVAPGVWRRYVDLLISGMAAQADALSPLTGDPPASEQVDVMLSQHGSRAR